MKGRRKGSLQERGRMAEKEGGPLKGKWWEWTEERGRWKGRKRRKEESMKRSWGTASDMFLEWNQLPAQRREDGLPLMPDTQNNHSEDLSVHGNKCCPGPLKSLNTKRLHLLRHPMVIKPYMKLKFAPILSGGTQNRSSDKLADSLGLLKRDKGETP